ncbi:MAG: hypothetical protein ACUVS2_01065 [Candidatus Flexifilum sp.]|jgi:hypothetical protein
MTSTHLHPPVQRLRALKDLPGLRALDRLVHHPGFLFVFILFFCAVVVLRLQVNSYDNTIHRRASINVYLNHRFPFEDPIERAFTLYFHPTHTAFLTAPFVMFTERPAAFWNIVLIAILYAGLRTGWAALIAATFVILPPGVFVIAAANMPGITTAFGLIFLLADKRGPLRAFSWAMMAGRPQDSVFTLLYSGWEALRQRDWTAFALAAGLMLPTLVTLNHWLAIVPTQESDLAINPGEFYSLSVSINNGIPAALLAVALVWGWRLLTIRREAGRIRLGWRRWGTLPRTEQYWLLTIAWLFVTPYYLAYMLWMVLLPVRLMNVPRLILTGLIVFVLGDRFMENLLPVGPLYTGALLTTAAVTLIAPRLNADPT